MKLIKPEESDVFLKSQIGEIKHSDDAIEQFLNFFKDYKTKESLVHKEADMLLFQYGVYDWQDGNGKEFNFELVRQFEIPKEDEFLQLSLSLFYDSAPIGEVASFNSWSIESKDLQEWKKQIKLTEGYERSRNLRPKRIEISLGET